MPAKHILRNMSPWFLIEGSAGFSALPARQLSIVKACLSNLRIGACHAALVLMFVLVFVLVLACLTNLATADESTINATEDQTSVYHPLVSEPEIAQQDNWNSAEAILPDTNHSGLGDGFQIAMADDAKATVTAPWQSAQKSSGDRPLEVVSFGNGEHTILIMGSVSGNDPASIRLVHEACVIASQYPPPTDTRLIFLKTLNPDGHYDLVNTNARGVDLDRNFPSRNFTSAPTRLTGPTPASEIETQYLMRLLDELQPVRIIHVRSHYGAASSLQYNSIWKSNTPQSVVARDVIPSEYQTSLRSGSIEEYVNSEKKIAIGTLFLASAGRRIAPEELLQLAVGGIAQVPNQTNPHEIATTTTAKPSMNLPMNSGTLDSTIPNTTIPTSTIPSTTIPEQSLSVGQPVPAVPQYPLPLIEKLDTAAPIEIGTKAIVKEVELLDPPSEFRSESVPPPTSEDPDRGYYELPPPPMTSAD